MRIITASPKNLKSPKSSQGRPAKRNKTEIRNKLYEK